MTANMQRWRQLARTKSSVTKRCQSGPSGWQAIFRISWGTPASIKGQKGGTEKSKGFLREVPLGRKMVLRPEAKRNILGSWTERIWLFQGRKVVRRWRQSKSEKRRCGVVGVAQNTRRGVSWERLSKVLRGLGRWTRGPCRWASLIPWNPVYLPQAQLCNLTAGTGEAGEHRRGMLGTRSSLTGRWGQVQQVWDPR